MTPSLPPGLASAPVAEAQPPSPAWQGLRHLFQHHSYAIIFAIVFLIRCTTRLRHYSGDETEEDAAVQARLLFRRLTRRWIRLVVVNAFVAFGGAIALQFMQQFSLTSFVCQFLGDLFHPVIHTIAQLVPGSGTIGRLASWYGENQLKFSFWLLYSAAICDDLGVPNYKTLARLLWQRALRPPEPAMPLTPGAN